MSPRKAAGFLGRLVPRVRPYRSHLLFALGQVHVQLGRCARAITFYTRFLASKPRRDQVAIAQEAIAVCKTAPTDLPKLAVEAAPPVSSPSPVVHLPPSGEPLRDVPPRSARPWYGNYVADGFVIAGVMSAIGSIIAHRAAVADLDRANRAATYSERQQHVESARTRRTASIALGVGGGLAIAGGGIGIALQRRF
jgi:hypothetical protein